MDSIIKIPDEDLAEADYLEAMASQTDDPDEAAGMVRIANLLRIPPNFPVLDDPRRHAVWHEQRQVIQELGAISPYFPREDSWKTVPVRLVHDAAGGFQIELGPFNLGRSELRVLARAINAWQQIENGTWTAPQEDDVEPAERSRHTQACDAVLIQLFGSAEADLDQPEQE